MDNKLGALEPKDVFYYFEELTRIPRGSGHTKEVSDYCVNFAKEHQLKVIQDELNNVIIIKEASAGYEHAPGIILQGHLDMVNEKNAVSSHDFTKDPLNLKVEGDFVFADGTTLGGDDGIAIAYALAILSDKQLKHPRLECVFTSDEEIGLLGAAGLDTDLLNSSYMINIDSEEEGIFLASCAGGIRCTLTLPLRRVEETRVKYTVRLEGLKGGHSGTEIHKGRGNANQLMGRLLFELGLEICYGIISLQGGLKDNAIPREAVAELLVDEADVALFESLIRRCEADYKNEYGVTDPQIHLDLIKSEVITASMVTPKEKELMLFLLINSPGGVQGMSANIEGLVESSLNMGVMETSQNDFRLHFSIRSSVKSKKRAMINQLEYLISFLGGSFTTSGDYPEWAYKKDSALRTIMCQVYEDLFQKKGIVQAIHAGLECGILSDKMPHLDIVSMGPDLFDAHTPDEKMSVSSVKRCYEFLLEVLKRIR